MSQYLRYNLLAAVLTAAAPLAAATAAQEESKTEPASQQQNEQVPAIAVNPPPEAQPEPDAAPDSGATQLDTIEVTATRLVKSQREIPGSVGAIRGETLEKLSAQQMKDYLKLVPGVSLNQFDAFVETNVPVIRGIATGSAPGSTQTPVGIYVDDVPFTDLGPPISVPDVNPFDVERVEVLKGPQGTLFGVGALAGAIHYILNKPNHSVWEAKAAATVMQDKYSADLSSVGAAAVNVPLFGDQLAFRLVGLVRKRAGRVDDLARGEKDVDGMRQTAGRLLGSWHASDRLNISGAYFQQDTSLDDFGYSSNQNYERSGNPYPAYSDSGFSGLNLSGLYEFDGSRLLLSSNLIRKRIHRVTHNESAISTGVKDPRQDNNTGNADIGLEDQRVVQYVLNNTSGVNGWLHELRWSSLASDSPWDWIGGAAYLKYDLQYYNYSPTVAPGGDYTREDVLPTGPIPTPIGPITGSRDLSLVTALQNIDTTELAAFGEVTRRLGDFWELTAGARIYETRVNARAQFASITNVPVYATTEKRQEVGSRERGVNPRFSLRYIHNRNIQPYLLVAKGFQIGGAQLAPPNLSYQTLAQQNGFTFGPYKSSKLWNYELGLRTEWLNRRLRLDAAFFYLDWTDLQLSRPVFVSPQTNDVTPTDLSFPLIGNIAAAHSEGVELSLDVVPFKGATFTSVATWISALTDVDYFNGTSTQPAGTRLPGSAPVQWTNSFNYARPLPFFSNWQGGLSLIHAYTGKSFLSLNQVFNSTQVGGYSTLDGRLSLIKSDSRFEPTLNVGVNNITDVRTPGFGSEDSRENYLYFISPRTGVLSLSLRY